jgi:hypothetical protein
MPAAIFLDLVTELVTNNTNNEGETNISMEQSNDKGTVRMPV